MKMNEINENDEIYFEMSYGDKCELIDEFFEKKGLAFANGTKIDDWFEYRFEAEGFVMDSACYTITIGMDGYFNVQNKKDCGIGDIDIMFMSDLLAIKDELIELLNEDSDEDEYYFNPDDFSECDFSE